MKRKVVGAVLALILVALFGGVCYAEEITVTLPGGATMEMVWIKPGTFMMGSPEDEPGREDNEGPQHQVTITKGFWMGKIELTQGQWTSVTGTRPWEGQWVQEEPNRPAVYISWYDVERFIAKLNEAEGDSVYRMPTEAEWEYACRAGTTTPWSFGDDESQLGEYAWYYDNCEKVGDPYAQPVGTKLPNPWGLHDMHGNVFESVLDWGNGGYHTGAAPQTDPTGPPSGGFTRIRGGSYMCRAREVRSAQRRGTYRTHAAVGRGVRLLRMQERVTPVKDNTWGQVKSLLK